MSYKTLKIKLDSSTKKSIDTSLNQLTLDLSFLVNLTATEIRRSLKIGPESRTFAQKILLLAKTSPESIPATVDIEQFETDLELIQELQSLHTKIATLQDSLKDTILALGHQSLQTANACYNFLKIANQTNPEMESNLAPILASRKYKKRKE